MLNFNVGVFDRARGCGSMVERSLPAPEICSLNPNIGKFYLPIVHFKIEKMQIKKKRPEIAHL